jgi:putative lipoprotein
MRMSAALLLTAVAASFPLAALARGESPTWALREVDGRPSIAEAQTTMRFSDNRITGSGGCNSYSGMGSIAEGRVSVGLLMMTKMGCAPDVLEQEARFASALPSSVRYEIDSAGAMRLFDARGRVTMRLTQKQ